jgi:phage-related minor tail protein
MSFVDGSDGAAAAGADLSVTLDGLQSRTNALGISIGSFASAMTRAFAQAATGGRHFDDVLKSLALRLSSLVVRNAFAPVATNLSKGLTDVIGNVFGLGSGGAGPVVPFASGGVIASPSYFPLGNGGIGLAGEAGPEAIIPLTRGADGRLGVAMAGGAPANVTVQIATPDAQSFRRSEAYITGQIARAVARGQRSL